MFRLVSIYIVRVFPALFWLVCVGAVQAQSVIPVSDKGGLFAAYVVPRDDFERVDVQLIVLSGTYDDPDTSGVAHLTEHLAAFSADFSVLRRPRERDVVASINNVSTAYTNSGPPADIDRLMRLARAVLDRPRLPPGFADSEIDIIERETFLRERQFPSLWLRRIALQNLYGTRHGRADDVVADLSKLSLEKAYEFHAQHYVPSNVTLIVSGKIDPERAADLVARHFGDTVSSTPAPPKPWLDNKPDPALRAVARLQSDRLSHDSVIFSKFVDYSDWATSEDLQGAFFIATSVLHDRLMEVLYYDDERFLAVDSDAFLARNADLELIVDVVLMPGFGLDAAHDALREAMATLLDTPISSAEIEQARHDQIVNAQDALRRPRALLSFLRNVAGDGFAPLSPSVFAQVLRDTTDQEVIDFAQAAMAPSATSVVLTEKVD